MTDKEILNHASLLRNEASQLLNNAGLLKLLQSYGDTRVIGSYTLDTMTWRDIDISIKLPHARDVMFFFEIGESIARKFQVAKMSFSNFFIRDFPKFDQGLYWGIQLLYAEHEWKIDLWGYGETEYDHHMSEFDELHEQLQQVDRLATLRIKHVISQRPDYRGDVYNSMNIYQASIENRITSVEEFNKWIERRYNVN